MRKYTCLIKICSKLGVCLIIKYFQATKYNSKSHTCFATHTSSCYFREEQRPDTRERWKSSLDSATLVWDSFETYLKFAETGHFSLAPFYTLTLPLHHVREQLYTYIPMSIRATFTSLSVGFTRAESSQLSLQLWPSSDKSNVEKKRQNKTRQDKTTLLHLLIAYTLMTDLAPQVAKLIEAGQEQ